MWNSVIVRLGGLHLIFLYMFSDSCIMSGRVLEEIWKTVYANGIPQMLSGDSYFRGLRAYVLIIQAIPYVVLTAPFVLDEGDTFVRLSIL